jgi:hypothetical protein
MRRLTTLGCAVRSLPIAALAFVLAPTLAGCSGTPTATLTLTTGDEADAFSRAPAPATLIVDAVDVDGNVQELARTPLPADDISLGDKGRTDVGAIRVRATDAAGNLLLKGETLFVQFGALESAPLEVFVQRVGELARLPRSSGAAEAPLLGLTVSRYVVAASGTGVSLFDLLLLKPITGLAALPRAARSFVTFGTAAVVIDEQGASTVDLSTGNFSELPAPAGGTFAELAGGATVMAPDGSAYVVGGTRTTGGASQRVLVITKEGATSFASLSAPREGACATWVDGRGLVVVGGGDATAAGAELLPIGLAQGTKLPYPADALKHCGASTLDASHVLVAGGVGSTADVAGAAPARVLDLACSADCKAVVWPGALPLVRADAFTLAPNAALLAGDDATGATRAFRASDTGLREVPLKAPRRGGRLLALPIKGTAAIVGGNAPIEQYVE